MAVGDGLTFHHHLEMLGNSWQPAAEVSWQSRRFGNGGYLALSGIFP